MAEPGWGDEASAPYGGAAAGANPTDRSKRGTKRNQFCEGMDYRWRWRWMGPTAQMLGSSCVGDGASDGNTFQRRSRHLAHLCGWLHLLPLREGRHCLRLSNSASPHVWRDQSDSVMSVLCPVGRIAHGSIHDLPLPLNAFQFVIVEQALHPLTLKHACLRPLLKASVRTTA